MPPRPSVELAAFELDFWETTARARGAAGWGDAYDAARHRDVKAWGYDVCAEATSMTFWNGAPYDELARSYVADLLNEAGDDKNLPFETNASRHTVLAMSAMEGTGWMSVLKQSEIYLNFAHIPSANVRGVADYTHDPLVRYSDSIWLEDSEWVSEAQRFNVTRDGYQFAIRTTSAVVIALFQARAP